MAERPRERADVGKRRLTWAETVVSALVVLVVAVLHTWAGGEPLGVWHVAVLGAVVRVWFGERL